MTMDRSNLWSQAQDYAMRSLAGVIPPLRQSVPQWATGGTAEPAAGGTARVSPQLNAVNRFMQERIDTQGGIIVGTDGITYQITKRGDNYFIKPAAGGAEMAAVVWFSKQGLSQQEQEALLGTGLGVAPSGGWPAVPTDGGGDGDMGGFNFEDWLASQGATGDYGPEQLAYLYSQQEQDRWWREQQMGLAYNEWMAEMQRSPLDWPTMWNITRGQQAPSWSTEGWGGWWSPQAGAAAGAPAGGAVPVGGGGVPDQLQMTQGIPNYYHGEGRPLTTEPYAAIAQGANQMYGGQMPMIPGWEPENMAQAFPGIEPMLQPGANIPTPTTRYAGSQYLQDGTWWTAPGLPASRQ